MSRIALDPNQFKHVSSDEHQTVLQHRAGHQIIIAHKKLSPKFREQLQALAKAPADKTEPLEDKKDDEVQKFAEGTKEPIKAETDPELIRKREIYNNLLVRTPANYDSGFGAHGEEPKNFDSKTWSKAETVHAEEKASNAAQAAAAQQQAISDNQSRTSAGLQPIPVPNVPEGPQVPGSQPSGQAAPASLAGAEQEAATQEAATQGVPKQEPDLLKEGFKQKLGGIDAKATAESNLGEEKSRKIQENIDAEVTAKKAYKDSVDDLTRDQDKLIKAINNNEISPDQYWSGDPKTGAGSHSKLATAIGIILAGFNPTNQPNAAVNLLKFQMEQNMQAQRDNLGKQKTLLEANLRQFGNLKDATEMTRLQLADIAQNEIAKVEAEATSPLARAAAQQAKGDIKMEYAPKAQQFALRQTINKLQASGDPAATSHMIDLVGQTDPEQAKQLRERFVPNVGLVNTADDAKLLKEVEVRRTSIRKNLDTAVQMVKKAGTYEAVGPHNAVLDGLMDQVATDMAKLQDPNSVARPAEVDLVKRSLIKSGVFQQDKTALDKLNAFYNTVDQRAADAYTMHGAKPPASMGLNPGVVKGKDGRMYRKVMRNGQSGYVPVK